MFQPPTKTSWNRGYPVGVITRVDNQFFFGFYDENESHCVKDIWFANLMPGSGQVSSFVVLGHAKYKYVAIAQADGSLSAWTYETDANRKGSRATESSPNLCIQLRGCMVPQQSQ
jgi:hypothetical protein